MCDVCDEPSTRAKHLILECKGRAKLRTSPKTLGPKKRRFLQDVQLYRLPLISHPDSPPAQHSLLSTEPTVVFTVFTDGSADPNPTPKCQIELLGSCVRNTLGTLKEVASGLSPGAWHNVLRAEPFAVLVALQVYLSPQLYVDNAAVVGNRRMLLEQGLDSLGSGSPNLTGIYVSKSFLRLSLVPLFQLQ